MWQTFQRANTSGNILESHLTKIRQQNSWQDITPLMFVRQRDRMHGKQHAFCSLEPYHDCAISDKNSLGVCWHLAHRKPEAFTWFLEVMCTQLRIIRIQH